MEEFKDLVVSCAIFAYTENVSVNDFKANAKYLLEKMGVTPETYFLDGGLNEQQE